MQFSGQQYMSFNDNKFTIGIFINLSKAFNTVNHETLLNKLNNYGVKENNLKLFSSYLQTENSLPCSIKHKNLARW